MFRGRLVSLALVVLIVWQAGCTYYSQVEIGDLPQIEEVRVTLSDGERQSVYDPWTDGNDLKGWRTSAGNSAAELSNDADISFTLESVSSIETRRISAGKTATLAMVVVFLIGGLIYAASDPCWGLGCE